MYMTRIASAGFVANNAGGTRYFITYPAPANETVNEPLPSTNNFQGFYADLIRDGGRMDAFLDANNLTLSGQDLHDDDDPRRVSILTDDERPFVQYGDPAEKAGETK